MKEMLALQDVSKRFGGLQALRGVTLSVDEGDVFGVIGPNGAGKTTLFNVISGALRPTTGHVRFRDDDVTHIGVARRAERGIVRTFQLTAVFGGMTVLENVMVGSHLRRPPSIVREFLSRRVRTDERRYLEAAARETIELVGLSDYERTPADALSYGHKKALSIAIAVAAEPSLLLLDEPVAGMDPADIDRTIALIQTLRARGHTVVLVEHNVGVVMGLCDRVAVLNFGEVIAEGVPAEIRTNPKVLDAYLGADEPGDASA